MAQPAARSMPRGSASGPVATGRCSAAPRQVLERAKVAELRQFLDRFIVFLRLHVTLAGAIRSLGSQRTFLVLGDRFELRKRFLRVALRRQADAKSQLDPLGQFLLRLAI